MSVGPKVISREEFIDFGQKIRREFPAATVTLRTDALLVRMPGSGEGGLKEFEYAATTEWLSEGPGRLALFRDQCRKEIAAYLRSTETCLRHAVRHGWDPSE